MASRAGPPLFNVVGRKAGSAPGYNYTDALSKAGVHFTQAPSIFSSV